MQEAGSKDEVKHEAIKWWWRWWWLWWW